MTKYSISNIQYCDIGWFTIDASIKIECFFEYFKRYITYYVHKNMRLLVDSWLHQLCNKKSLIFLTFNI